MIRRGRDGWPTDAAYVMWALVNRIAWAFAYADNEALRAKMAAQFEGNAGRYIWLEPS